MIYLKAKIKVLNNGTGEHNIMLDNGSAGVYLAGIMGRSCDFSEIISIAIKTESNELGLHWY